MKAQKAIFGCFRMVRGQNGDNLRYLGAVGSCDPSTLCLPEQKAENWPVYFRVLSGATFSSPKSESACAAGAIPSFGREKHKHTGLPTVAAKDADT